MKIDPVPKGLDGCDDPGRKRAPVTISKQQLRDRRAQRQRSPRRRQLNLKKTRRLLATGPGLLSCLI